jgi:hypothetical protein
LIAEPGEIAPRDDGGDGEIEIRALDSGDGRDELLWEGALGVQLANEAADPQAGAAFEPFARARQRDLRTLFRAGRGAWYVAIDRSNGAVVAGCGVVATRPSTPFPPTAAGGSHPLWSPTPLPTRRRDTRWTAS